MTKKTTVPFHSIFIAILSIFLQSAYAEGEPKTPQWKSGTEKMPLYYIAAGVMPLCIVFDRSNSRFYFGSVKVDGTLQYGFANGKRHENFAWLHVNIGDHGTAITRETAEKLDGQTLNDIFFSFYTPESDEATNNWLREAFGSPENGALLSDILKESPARIECTIAEQHTINDHDKEMDGQKLNGVHKVSFSVANHQNEPAVKIEASFYTTEPNFQFYNTYKAAWAMQINEVHEGKITATLDNIRGYKKPGMKEVIYMLMLSKGRKFVSQDGRRFITGNRFNTNDTAHGNNTLLAFGTLYETIDHFDLSCEEKKMNLKTNKLDTNIKLKFSDLPVDCKYESRKAVMNFFYKQRLEEAVGTPLVQAAMFITFWAHVAIYYNNIKLTH